MCVFSTFGWHGGGKLAQHLSPRWGILEQGRCDSARTELHPRGGTLGRKRGSTAGGRIWYMAEEEKEEDEEKEEEEEEERDRFSKKNPRPRAPGPRDPVRGASDVGAWPSYI